MMGSHPQCYISYFIAICPLALKKKISEEFLQYIWHGGHLGQVTQISENIYMAGRKLLNSKYLQQLGSKCHFSIFPIISPLKLSCHSNQTKGPIFIKKKKKKKKKNSKVSLKVLTDEGQLPSAYPISSHGAFSSGEVKIYTTDTDKIIPMSNFC